MLNKTRGFNSLSTGSVLLTVAHKDGVFLCFEHFTFQKLHTHKCVCVCVKGAVVNAMSLSISDARFPSAVGPCHCIKDFFYDVENVAYKDALMRQLDG